MSYDSWLEGTLALDPFPDEAQKATLRAELASAHSPAAGRLSLTPLGHGLVCEGAVDWEAALEDMAEQGIELRGGDAEEAAGAYKRLDEVLDAHGDTIAVKQNLRPIAVVMAPADVADPYKD